MLRNLIILTITFLLSSCSVNQHLKRSKRQLDKAIEKGYVLKIDSVYVNDTTYIPKIEHDTTFLFKRGDTIEVERERLRYKIIRDIRTDSIFIDVECKADTIIKEVLVEVICDPIYIKETLLEHFGIKKTWQKILFFITIIGFIIILLVRNIRSK
jgi:hypothetical protein